VGREENKTLPEGKVNPVPGEKGGVPKNGIQREMTNQGMETRHLKSIDQNGTTATRKASLVGIEGHQSYK